MSTAIDDPDHESLLEQCIDEVSTLIDGMRPYPEPVLAAALRVHLSGLLRAMIDADVCTRAQVTSFLEELERETLDDL